jgi:hypothetical protein
MNSFLVLVALDIVETHVLELVDHRVRHLQHLGDLRRNYCMNTLDHHIDVGWLDTTLDQKLRF